MFLLKHFSSLLNQLHLASEVNEVLCWPWPLILLAGDDQQTGLRTCTWPSGANFWATGWLVCFREKQPETWSLWVQKFYWKAPLVIYLSDSSSVEKSYSVVSLSPLMILSSRMSRLSLASFFSFSSLLRLSPSFTWLSPASSGSYVGRNYI